MHQALALRDGRVAALGKSAAIKLGGIHSLLTLVGGRVVYADGPFVQFEERR